MTVGPAGGIVTSADGRLTVEFPPGALATDTEIGIEPYTNTAPLGIGDAYELTPDGATFMQPVTLTFAYGPGDYAGASPEAQAIAFQDDEGFWRRVGEPVLDETARTVRAETTHFTTFSNVLGWQLTPAQANVQPGGIVGLTLVYCEPEDVSDGSGDTLLGPIRCDPGAEVPNLVRNIRGWAVNGTPAGSASDGFVAANGTAATYTAPAVPPTRNPVAVSCEFNRGRGTNLAVANITVGPPGWSGQINWVMTGSEEATETFSVESGSGTRTTTRTASGSGTIVVGPGAFGTVEVESATVSYHFNERERGMGTSRLFECEFIGESMSATTLDGDVTQDDPSEVDASVVLVESGASGTLYVILPTVLTAGQLVADATSVPTSGSPAECDRSEYHNMDPLEGAMPSDAFMISAAIEGTSISGTVTMTVGEFPPREYMISYNFTR